jgi:hypothetical protein
MEIRSWCTVQEGHRREASREEEQGKPLYLEVALLGVRLVGRAGNAFGNEGGQVALRACCPPDKPDTSPAGYRSFELELAITTWTNLSNFLRAKHVTDCSHLVPCERATFARGLRHTNAKIAVIG